MQQKHYFGHDCEIEKRDFGHDYEIKYDCIINHDTYNFLKVTLEVERGQSTEAMVLLNGRIIGKVIVLKEGKKTLGYKTFRNSNNTFVDHHPNQLFKEMGRAVAAIISDYVIPNY